MKEYEVTIRENIVTTYIVKAESEEQAKNLYESGIVVREKLLDGEIQCVEERDSDEV